MVQGDVRFVPMLLNFKLIDMENMAKKQILEYIQKRERELNESWKETAKEFGSDNSVSKILEHKWIAIYELLNDIKLDL